MTFLKRYFHGTGGDPQQKSRGEYQNAIMEMITHMQGNSGRPYRSLLMDKALKEQVLNDHSSDSSLLRIKGALQNAVKYEYGFRLLDMRDDLFNERGNFKTLSRAALPKFDRAIDNTDSLLQLIFTPAKFKH